MLELVLRIGFSLLVVFGLMWGMARLARKPLGGGRAGAPLTVLARQQLSRGASVAVVKVADRAIVLGVTDSQVTLIGETEPAAFAKPAPADRRDTVAVDGEQPAAEVVAEPGRLHGSLLSPRTWAATVEFLRERTVRR